MSANTPQTAPQLFQIQLPYAVEPHPSANSPQAPNSQTPTRGQRGLPHIAGLDGIRAVAVAVVVLYHLGISWMPGGFLGVEVFFVLSGYLITCLLLAEHENTGTISLKNFWARRARRLLPALGVLLVGTTAFVAIAFTEEASQLWDQLAGAIVYATNWLLIFQNQSYFEAIGRPEVLQHLWSLAVEEQFYLLWPLIFMAGIRLGRRRFATVIAVGAVASTALMWILYVPLEDPSRIYYGTDTRASGLLLGALLAFVWRPWLWAEIPGWLRAIANYLAATAVGGVIFWCVYLTERDDLLYRGGFLTLAATTAVAVGAMAVPGTWFGRAFESLPLKWLGVRSYAIYLWHWPVFIFTRPRFDVTLDGWQLLLLRLGATLVLADLSYRFIEQPIRTRTFRQTWQAWLQLARSSLRALVAPLGVGAAVSVVLVAVLVPQISHDIPEVGDDSLILEVPDDFADSTGVVQRLLREDSIAGGIAGIDNIGGSGARGDDIGGPDDSEYATAMGSETDEDATAGTPSSNDTTSTTATNNDTAVTDTASTHATSTANPPAISPNTILGLPAFLYNALANSLESGTPQSDDVLEDISRLIATWQSSPDPNAPDPVLFSPPPGDWDGNLPRITAFGDSVLLGTRAFMDRAFGEYIQVDAVVSRQFSELPALIREYKENLGGQLSNNQRPDSQLSNSQTLSDQPPDNQPLGDIVLVHLGTNGLLNAELFDSVMEELADVPRVLFVNVRVPKDWEESVNKTLQEGTQRWENAWLIDWNGYTHGQEEVWLHPRDGVHMVPQGAKAYLRLLLTSI